MLRCAGGLRQSGASQARSPLGAQAREPAGSLRRVDTQVLCQRTFSQVVVPVPVPVAGVVLRQYPARQPHAGRTLGTTPAAGHGVGRNRHFPCRLAWDALGARVRRGGSRHQAVVGKAERLRRAGKQGEHWAHVGLPGASGGAGEKQRPHRRASPAPPQLPSSPSLVWCRSRPRCCAVGSTAPRCAPSPATASCAPAGMRQTQTGAARQGRGGGASGGAPQGWLPGTHPPPPGLPPVQASAALGGQCNAPSSAHLAVH